MKNKAQFLITLGTILLLTTNIATIPFTVKATRAYDEKKRKLNKKKLGLKETVKTVAPYAVIPLVTAASGATLIFTGNNAYIKNAAALATYAASTSKTLATFKEKLPEIVGEKKAQEVKEAVAKQEVDNMPKNRSTIIETGNGDVEFYEPITNIYFKSSINKIASIANQITAAVNDNICGEVSFTEFFYKLNLDIEPEQRSITDILVWSNAKSFEKGKCVIEFVAAEKNGRPVFVITPSNLALKDRDGSLNYDWQ